MDTNKMREQFEAALIAMHVATGMPECDARSFLEVGSNGYTSVYTKAAWWAWQASREALLVELPDAVIGARRYQHAEAAFAHKEGIDECRSAIEAQGLKVTP